jgi:hypothetical protein
LDHYQFDTFSLPINILGRPLVSFKGSAGQMETVYVGGKIDIEFRRSDKRER